ncbi:hypothetical protein CMO88_04775 [Candidatus Woesearchaeota archaeon]|nr:hypothetical protein [Candidatus Woesearchaeota archaeon]|tara:strand:- start:270 stop:530 length:261 start_codon:yes stop_codon:yes gene_type:complete
MIKRFKVNGHSMEPAFYDGDNLIFSSLFFNLNEGDVIVFNSDGRDYLKRIKKAAGNQLVVSGDNKSHSRTFNISSNKIKGKLLMKY